MRIALKATGSEILTWLAGDPDVDVRTFLHAGGLTIVPTISSELQGGVRATKKAARDRGNLSTTISFNTARLFDTVEQAELWAQDYDADFPRDGTLVMESLQVGGGYTRRYLADSVVLPPERQVIGLSVLLKYSVIGGQISDLPPA